jgi:hypothetical protein
LVRVEALPKNYRHIAELYRRLGDGTARLHDHYDDRQLALVVDYLSRALTLVAEHVAWLQTQRPLAQRTVRRPRRSRRVPPSAAAQILRT